MVALSTNFRFHSQVLLWICVFGMTTSEYEVDDLYHLFQKFTNYYRRTYVTNATEYEYRFKIFKNNVEQAERLNNDYSSSDQPVYGVTKFSDLTPDEFKDLYLSSYVPKLTNNQTEIFNRPVSFIARNLGVPHKVDWRSKNVVTSIKNQKSCGACWAFAIVETMESMLAIQNNETTYKFSVQQVIDCDSSDKGCEGGDICKAATWASDNGIVEESHYPLTDQTDPCKSVADNLPRLKVKSHTCSDYRGKEDDLLKDLVKGPVAVAVDASTWHSYVRGIIRFHCDGTINHAVAVVGYDLTGDVPYYIVRNSWGTDFGDEGYLYVKVGDNLCGIATEVSAMTVTDFK